MDNLLFRCSSVGALLTEPRSSEDKKAGKLSETAKTLIQSMWLEKKFGYREYVNTDAMDKGLNMEQDSMALVQSVIGGQFRVKNREKFSNDYIIGTPDIILSDCIEDIKTSWSLRTFYEAEPTTIYKVQAQCYMALKGIKKYRLIYALVPNTPEMIINEKERLAWKFGKNYDNEDYINQAMQIDRNNALVNELLPSQRIKVFNYDYDPALIENLYSKIEKAREYYDSLEMPCYIATHDHELNATIINEIK